MLSSMKTWSYCTVWYNLWRTGKTFSLDICGPGLWFYTEHPFLKCFKAQSKCIFSFLLEIEKYDFCFPWIRKDWELLPKKLCLYFDPKTDRLTSANFTYSTSHVLIRTPGIAHLAKHVIVIYYEVLGSIPWLTRVHIRGTHGVLSGYSGRGTHGVLSGYSGSGWNRSPMLHKYKPAPVANSTSHNNTTLRKKKKKKLDKINLRCRKYHTLVIMPPNPPGMLILSFIYILLSLAYIFNSFSVYIISETGPCTTCNFCYFFNSPFSKILRHTLPCHPYFRKPHPGWSFMQLHDKSIPMNRIN